MTFRAARITSSPRPSERREQRHDSCEPPPGKTVDRAAVSVDRHRPLTVPSIETAAGSGSFT